MADWREKAATLLPELSAIAERVSWSCHVFLSQLWQLAAAAHRSNDIEVLTRAYEFAYWCFRQKENFLSNAAVVSFYEHVFDEWDLREQVAPWLPADVIVKVRPLWEWRWPVEQLAEFDQLRHTLTRQTQPEANAG